MHTNVFSFGFVFPFTYKPRNHPSLKIMANPQRIFWRLSTVPRRYLSSSSPSKPPGNIEPRITVTDDRQTIVCWHPPESFPYENSLSFDEVRANHQEHQRSSVMNIQTMIRGQNIYYKRPADRMAMEQLYAITYTNKYYWKRRRADGLQLRPNHPRKGV